MNPPEAPKSTLLNLLHRHKKKPSKRLGQHYFIDNAKADSVLHFFDFPKKTPVVEVGPGMGFWTEKLLQQNHRVVGIELEQASTRILQEQFGVDDLGRFCRQKKLALYCMDIRRLDLRSVLKETNTGLVSIFGALPYYATSKILMRVFEWSCHLERVGVLLQDEVANRLTASVHSKRYGALSVLLQAYFHIELGPVVGRGSFYPEPKVNSVALRMRPRQPKVAVNAMVFKKLVRAAFNQRRKGLLKALKTSPIERLEIDRLEAVFGGLASGLSATRPEDISPEQYLQLAVEYERRQKPCIQKP